jgi:hypothetical protein
VPSGVLRPGALWGCTSEGYAAGGPETPGCEAPGVE